MKALNKKIIGIIIITILAVFFLWVIDFGNIPHPGVDSDAIEYLQVNAFVQINNAQECFKYEGIKDQNKNSVGEYATSLELAEYLYGRGRDKTDLPKRFPLGKDGDFLHRSAYKFRIFLPDQIDTQESQWLCLAIPERNMPTGYGRSYFLDNKNGIILYAERTSLEDLKGIDEWSLKKIFCGEPFRSPIDTSRWKILERNLREVGK